MNKTSSEAVSLAKAVKKALSGESKVDIVLCPPFTALSEVAKTIAKSNLMLGGQDCHWEKSGAYTGEISALMLKDMGCRYSIVGHSERRQYFNETNESVNKKAIALIKEGISPIMCVGENLEEREKGKTFEIVENHVRGGLKGISALDMLKIVIAYEPVWAIGTGKTATPGQAEEVHKLIRDILSKLYNAETASLVRIQYGGSVKPDNISELMNEPDIDGALVGGASLDADSFIKIVKGSIKQV